MVMQEQLPTEPRREATLNYHCSQGFSENLTFVDPDGRGFAFAKYDMAMLSKHNLWHRENSVPPCGGMEISRVQT